MAPFTRKKSKKQKASDLLGDYLKLKTAGKAAKGAGKGAKKAAKGTAVVVASKPVWKRIPFVVGAAVAALVAAKMMRGRHSDPAAA